MSSTCLTQMGLILDILGGVIILRFGLPSKVDQGDRRVTEREPDHIGNRRIKIFANVGLGLLILGFVFQFIGTICFNTK